MEIILDIINKNKQKLINNFNLDETDFKRIKNTLQDVRWNKLYSSKIHGQYHSEKVFLFSYLIGKQNNFDDIDMTIISDAAIYHDMGRINDNEESLHGYASTLKVDGVLNNDIYNQGENLQHLKAIIEGHSVNDDRCDYFYEYHDLTEKERYMRLYNALKDADALDRHRFYSTCNSFLDERFLRTDAAKSLVSFSKEVNDIYKERLLKETKNKFQKETEELAGKNTCFHSVGFDFFKINSILENGILSKNEMNNKGIDGASNFQGGNLDDYISVVDANMIEKNGSAFKTFIMNGVSFICEVNKLYSSNDSHTKSYCIENGLPYNHSSYEDEKYVRGEISADEIVCMYIPNKQKDSDIRNLNYIYNSLSYEVFFKRIKHYYNNVSLRSKPDLQELDQLLKDYKQVIEKYIFLDSIDRAREKDNIVNQLEKIRIQINKVIQKWIYNHYTDQMNISDNIPITVEDAVIHEIKRVDYNCRVEKNDSATVIYLNKELSKGQPKR